MDLSLHSKLLSSRVYPEFFPVTKDDTVLYAGCGEGAQVLVYGNVGRRITCADVQKERVENALKNAEAAGIKNIEGVSANLESLPFTDNAFDKIIAVDVVQHVQNSRRVLTELKRVLKVDGEMLITFPALQHFWLTKISKWKHERGKSLDSAPLRSGQPLPHIKIPREGWNPDAFNHNLSLREWLKISEFSGLWLVRSHATTLFLPLHRYGFRRFWFSNDVIHRIDYFFGGLPVFRRIGQAIMCVYRKK